MFCSFCVKKVSKDNENSYKIQPTLVIHSCIFVYNSLKFLQESQPYNPVLFSSVCITNFIESIWKKTLFYGKNKTFWTKIWKLIDETDYSSPLLTVIQTNCEITILDMVQTPTLIQRQGRPNLICVQDWRIFRWIKKLQQHGLLGSGFLETCTVEHNELTQCNEYEKVHLELFTQQQ